MKEVILIFDVGKTNKKVLLFDRNLKVVHEEESVFEEVRDEDGFSCDDASKLEQWTKETIGKYLALPDVQIKGINVSTYGATLVYLDAEGNRLTPIYNYLKPLPDQLLETFYKTCGGAEEFARRTASPALGMLNSGFQLLWLKETRPAIFEKVKHILHLPQYLSYLFHGEITSEHTSIGCHTAMWNFDTMHYDPWLKEEGITLPEPQAVSETFQVTMRGQAIQVGIGIHDSSSSLAPYMMAAEEPFILVSTGTWCISMNPFNQEPLSAQELKEDCLCFLGVHGKAVKSSRFFLGRIHDLNVERLQQHFKKDRAAYKGVNPGTELIREYWESGIEGCCFFKHGIPEGWVDQQIDLRLFGSFDEAYTRLMVDLSRQVAYAIGLIIAQNDSTKHLYITGGFAKNPIFTTTLSFAFPDKILYTSEVANASSLGAALVMADNIWKGASTQLDLGLTSPVPHRSHR